MTEMIEQKIGDALMRIGQAQRSLTWQQAGEAGLTPTQAQILVYLQKGEFCRIGEIAQAMGVSQPTVTESVAAMVRKGLVEKQPDPADGRGRILALTVEGKALAGDFMLAPPPMRSAVSALTGEQQDALLIGLMHLMQGLDREGALASAKICFSCRHYQTDNGTSYCGLMETVLPPADLRLDCADHERM